MLGTAARASALTITFDDTATGGFVPQGYDGFTWGGGFGQNSWVLGTGSFGSATSLNGYYAWSNGGTSLSMSDGLFDFTSMWAVNGCCGGTGIDTAHGFLNGVEIFTQQFSPTTTWQLFTFNFTGIDTLTFDNTSYNLLVDDIIVNGSTVPEPASLLLLGSGLVGVATRMRRRPRA